MNKVNTEESTEEIKESNIKEFSNSLKLVIAEIYKARRIRPMAPEGYKYKRDWFNRLNKSENELAKLCIENIDAIWNKTSNLNSETRNVISYICSQAIQNTITSKLKK